MKGLIKIAAIKDSVRLQKHQSDVLDYSKNKSGVLINHGLGSGKTLSSLAIAEQKGGNVLVVTPASLQQNYKKELKNFVTADRHNNYHVVSYSKFRRNPQKYIDKYKPTTLVADEVHRARNPGKTRAALDLARRQVPNMVGMTASLVNNHPSEVVPLVNMVAGKNVMTETDFMNKHVGRRVVKPGLIGRFRGIKPGEVEYIKNKGGLNRTLSPHVHRFTGSEDYQKNLPRTKYENVDVEMSKRQVELMRHLEGKDPALAYKIKNNLPPSKKELANMNAFMMGMRQVSNSPHTHDKTITDPVANSPKMKRVISDIKEMSDKDPNYRGVVYSNFLSSGVEPITANINNSEAYKGSLTQKQRKEVLNRFGAGQTRVLGMSPAGGEGIDLKGVKSMSVLEPSWNPERTNQAIGRSVRYKSHHHLPENEREVNIRSYRSVYPTKWYHKVKKKPMGIDEYISNRSQEKAQLNADFYTALNQLK